MVGRAVTSVLPVVEVPSDCVVSVVPVSPDCSGLSVVWPSCVVVSVVVCEVVPV